MTVTTVSGSCRSENRTFNGLPGNNYTLNYAYNQADQVKSANYHATGGFTAGSPFTQTDSGQGGAESYTISGTVTDAQSQPVSGATVILSGSQSVHIGTNGSGQYSFTGLTPGGNYTVTPSGSGLVFDPSSRTYNNLQSNKTSANFTALPAFVTFLNKNVNYAYNSVGALTGVGTNLIGANPNATTNVLNTVAFRASGALSSLIYGNGRQLTMGYNDQRSQPISMKVDRIGNPADKVLDYEYQYYDAQGKNNNRLRQITDKVDGAFSSVYTYDDYNRLQSGGGNFYQYDPWGNIKSVNFGLTYNYATSANGAPATNRLESVALNGVTQTSFSYDAAGNTTSGEGKTFAYDAVNRLKAVNGGASTYGYDGDGKRVRVTDGGAAVYYVYSSALGQSVMEVTSSGVQRAYVYGGGKVVAMQATDGQFYWLHQNHLGSSRALTDANGNLAYKGHFDPFGQALSEWSSSGNNNLNSKKFTGYERDAATGIDYAMARGYNSARGRFLQPDPISSKNAPQGQPQGLNRYSYVQNDPVNATDPTGEFLSYCGWGIWNRSSTALLRLEYAEVDGQIIKSSLQNRLVGEAARWRRAAQTTPYSQLYQRSQ